MKNLFLRTLFFSGHLYPFLQLDNLNSIFYFITDFIQPVFSNVKVNYVYAFSLRPGRLR